MDDLAAPPAYNTSTERLTTDYLTALRRHAERVLRYRLGPAIISSTPVEYVLSVPALWPDLAQRKTRDCAAQAGMGVGSALHLVSEPEAAAIHCLNDMKASSMKVGQTFVILDAGGGTVDLITYTVTALKPTLELSEASPGIGHCCGSAILNRIFALFLQKKLGETPRWGKWVLEDALHNFEHDIKRSFRGTFGETFHVPVPNMENDDRLGIKRNKMVLTGTELRAIFEPVFNEILKSVRDQIGASKTPVTAVIVVGGFGCNSYLCDEIRREIVQLPGKIQVIQPANAWTAVVRGALMKGLATVSPAAKTVHVHGRRARKHYGFSVSRFYRSGALVLFRCL